MKVGLVSDTHDRIRLSQVAASWLRRLQVDVAFHLGDITTPEGAAPFRGLPMTFLRGNNDYNPALEPAMWAAGLPPPVDEWRGEIAGVRIGAAHGHEGWRLRGLLKRSDVVLRGHSHRAGVERVEGALVVNPGALHRAPVKTMAVLDLPSLDVAFYEVREDGVVPWTPPTY